MTNICKKICLIIAFLSLSDLAFAYDATDKQIIKQSIDLMESSYDQHNIKPVLDFMPPQTFEVMAQYYGVSAQQIKHKMESTANAISKLPENDKLTYTYDLEKVKVYKTKLNREYLIIPTKLTSTDGTTEYSKLFAVKDNNQWYFLRLGSPIHLKFIKEMYPDIEQLPNLE